MIVSRFAPAPTGLLHLGHVVNAIHVWGLTRAAGGRVLLRIEDHDRQRSRPEFEAAILGDLDWLGFQPDAAAVRQSDRQPLYIAALDRLRAAGLVYACECSRRMLEGTGARLESSGAAPVEPERRYPGTCRTKGLSEAGRVAIRVHLPRQVETFEDLRHGRQSQCAADQCGDLLLRDRGGNWSYQFAASVDDLEQQVTLVIRGDDLLPSTGRQIQLARLLGRAQPPAFLHHALVMKSPTQKLSKADGDTSVRDFRAAGQTAAQVIAAAARHAGLTDASRVTADDAASLVGPRYVAALTRGQ